MTQCEKLTGSTKTRKNVNLGTFERYRKPNIYEQFSSEVGQKVVYFSDINSAAVVALESRKAAVDMYQKISEKGEKKLLGKCDAEGGFQYVLCCSLNVLKKRRLNVGTQHSGDC